MDYVFNSVAILGISIFVIFALINLLIFISSLVIGGERHISMLPLIGGICGCISFALIPSLRFYAWLPLLLDAGTATIIFAIPTLAYEAWKTSSPNLVTEYVALADDRKATIRLFKKQVFTLKYQVSRKPDGIGLTELNTIGKWLEEADTLRLDIGETRIIFEKAHTNGREEIHWVSGFEKYLNGLVFTKTQV
jgi:hypothetical protein